MNGIVSIKLELINESIHRYQAELYSLATEKKDGSETSERKNSQAGITEMICILGDTFYIVEGKAISERNYHFFVIGGKIWLVVIDIHREIQVFVSPADNVLVAEILSERSKRKIAEYELQIEESGNRKSIHVYTLRATVSIQLSDSGYTIWSDVYKYRRSSIENSFSTTLEQSSEEEFTQNGGLLANEILELKHN